MRIKLTDDQFDTVEKINMLRAEMQRLAMDVSGMITSIYDELKIKYPDKNFSNASIDHKTKELVLPFQNDID